MFYNSAYGALPLHRRFPQALHAMLCKASRQVDNALRGLVPVPMSYQRFPPCWHPRPTTSRRRASSHKSAEMRPDAVVQRQILVTAHLWRPSGIGLLWPLLLGLEQSATHREADYPWSTHAAGSQKPTLFGTGRFNHSLGGELNATSGNISDGTLCLVGSTNGQN
ncbi:hypothetical protein H9L39_01333 [Fusarium oxysporum f. sp. albedinis]|nr:hypothetical protein H9L39_01333 [Fusarium oxysporum f. sp. albedinis]